MPTSVRGHPSVDSRIKRIFDHLYANAAVRTPSAIAAEVGKLIRTATYVEKRTGSPAAFSFAPGARSRLVLGDETAVRTFAAEVRGRFAEMSSAWQLYGSGDGFLLSDADLAWCCAELDGVPVSSERRDVFGDAVEIFRTTWAKQSSGQFFTDASVAHLVTRLLEFDPLGGDDLVDICCGTGGFLLAGLDTIRRAVASRHPEGERERETAEIAARTLMGQEIDPDICDMARASLVCRIGHNGNSVVARGDSLNPAAFRAGGVRLREGTHLCAASNPPFGTKMTVKDPALLMDYELAREGRVTGRPTPRAPDILLLEKNVRMLKPGAGRAAIVVPYQILSGPQTRYIREWLLRNTILEAVVDLPAETFQPHTGTKTSVLVVRRRERPTDDVRKAFKGTIFMSTPKWIGHDRRGKPVFVRDAQGRPTGELLCDLDAVARAFSEYRKGRPPGPIHGESFEIAARQVASDPDLRLNARYYREGERLSARRKTNHPVRTVRLGAVVDRVFFPGRFKRNYIDPCEGAVPFYGGANITQLIPPIEKWLAPDDPRLPELVVREGWILVTRSGSTGIVSSVPRAWDGVAMSEHVIRIVPRPAALHPAWIQAFLRSDLGQSALARGVFGSVIDEITPEFIERIEIPLPPVPAGFEVIERLTAGEHARQQAIDGISGAVAELEALLGASGPLSTPCQSPLRIGSTK